MVSAMRKYLSFFLTGIMALACLRAPLAHASLVLDGTRVIFPGQARDVSLQVRNTSNTPVLMQSWIDDGRTDVLPDLIKTPFIIAPVIGRVEPASSAVLRIRLMQQDLPQDRESVYWLNIIEVAARSKDQQSDLLQISYRTRIKLFYRPVPLGVASEAKTASGQLRWELAAMPEDDGKSLLLEAHNPTPYYVSLSRITLKSDDKVVSGDGGMIAPFSSKTFRVEPLPGAASQHAVVRYQAINDFGGNDITETPLAGRSQSSPSAR